MNRIVDVLVAGSGMAGFMAALTAASRGKKVRMLTTGMGSLAISGGSIDLLGYVDGRYVADPWAGMAMLPANHPYRLMDEENVREALHFFQLHMADQRWPMRAAANADGQPCNVHMPTIMGTLKPTYLLPERVNISALKSARRVLVVSVEGLRDCRPALVISQLRRYRSWADREFSELTLPSPLGQAHRSASALDLARLMDKPQSRQWLTDALTDRAGSCDLVLLPPVCGSKAQPETWEAIEKAAGCPVVEMLSIPPGVGGLRLRDALLRALRCYDFEMVENARALCAETDGSTCTALIAEASGQERRHEARTFVLATGGILGGGLTLQPGMARESVMGLDVAAPANVEEWSSPALFGRHFFAAMGVRVDSAMRPVDSQASPYWPNVFFAGRSLGGYDYAAEKSGHGVAVATGWQAGRMAAAAAEEGR